MARSEQESRKSWEEGEEEPGRVVGRDLWVGVVEGYVSDPEGLDWLIYAMAFTGEAIGMGSKIATKAREALRCGLERAYLETEEHKAALRLYELMRTGYVDPEDEPLRVLSGPLERGEAQALAERKRIMQRNARAAKRGSKRKKRS